MNIADETAATSRRGARRVRVIPTLLIDSKGRLVKTERFAKRTYIGDPINAVRIFNGKEVDELILLDIDASRDKREPDYALIEDIVSEAFMPVAYGGGIHSIEQVERLFKCGIEKVVLSSCLANGDELIRRASFRFGAQAVVICLQVRRSWLGGYSTRFKSGKTRGGGAPREMARRVVASGAGEVIVYSIDRDGTFAGYDLPLLETITAAVDVPVVACGGARGVGDFRAAIADAGCSAVAAGSMFVYQSRTRGVLISYPSQRILREGLFDKVQ
jgi:cyclase